MPLAVQIILCLSLLALTSGVVYALLTFPQHAHRAPIAYRERVRSLAGLLAVLVGDAAIVLVTVWGVDKLGGLKAADAIALVTAGFTAVSTMTTAYIGIKAVANTAQVLTQQGGGGGGRDDGGGGGGPDGPAASEDEVRVVRGAEVFDWDIVDDEDASTTKQRVTEKPKQEPQARAAGSGGDAVN